MNTPTWELNTFDTDIFGFRVAKILHIPPPSKNPHAISHLLDELKKSDIRYATYRFQASDIALIHALESHDFRMVDGFLEMQIPLENYHFADSTEQIREAVEADIPELTRLVRPLFTQTRFYNDPVTRQFAGEEFVQWTINSVRHKAADAIYVWIEEGAIAGFISLRFDGHIPLVGVSKAHQGKGISRKLVKYALHVLQKRGVASGKIETQIMNIPALRSYLSCGFNVTQSFVTFRWHRPNV